VRRPATIAFAVALLALAPPALADETEAAEEPAAAAEEETPAPDVEIEEVRPFAAASDAWATGEIPKAGPLYEEALKQGGLSPAETLVAFIRVGVYRAGAGKADAALNAFRNAALLDPEFEYPAEGGARGKLIAQKARAAAQGQPRVAVEVEAPEKVEGGEDFEVVAKLPDTLVPLFEALRVEVADRSGRRLHQEDLPPVPETRFTIPGKVLRPGAALVITVIAVDPQHNEWARSEVSSRVKSAPLAPIAPPPPPPPPPKPSVWSTPMPYAVGGAVVLVATVILVATVAGGGSDVAHLDAPAWRAPDNSR
jgi:hypothetical protein